jgi:hypothetical protein
VLRASSTSRTTGGSTATLSYDVLDHLSKWNHGANNEHYLYDASGNRVLRRSINGGATTITTYPFGTEEHTYSGTGTLQSNTYYYSLGGRLIGELSGSPTPLNTNIFLSDALGSVLATFQQHGGQRRPAGQPGLRPLWQPALQQRRHGYQQRLHRQIWGYDGVGLLQCEILRPQRGRVLNDEEYNHFL